MCTVWVFSPEDSGKGKGKAKAKEVAVAAAHPEQFNGQPWVEKFRPSCLSDLVAHEEIIGIRK